MKHLITLALIATPALASAGGMSLIVSERPTPRPEAPATFTPYAGLSYGRTMADTPFSETFTIPCEKPRNPKARTVRPCEPETYTVTGTTETETDEAGVFAGIRWDMGPLVGGIEVTATDAMQTLEGHVGLPVGDALPYVFAGAGELDGERGDVFGAGIDYMISDNWMVGIKATRGQFGDTTTEGAALRVGWVF